MDRYSCQLKAFAKVNLRLDVVGKRSDGYHLLRMVNATVSLADTISLVVNEGSGRISFAFGSGNRVNLEDSERNLCERAAERFLEFSQLPLDIQIVLEKSIPAGAGLGGGSSDAAAVILGLQRAVQKLFHREVASAELERLCASLGADIPYFFHGGGLREVAGIGEKTRVLQSEGLSGFPLVLVLPMIHMPTVAVFHELQFNGAPKELPAIEEPLTAHSIQALVNNDLFEAAVRLEPALAEIAGQLALIEKTFFSMSGSGSSFFVFPETRLDSIEELQERFPPEIFPEGCALRYCQLLDNSFHFCSK